MRPYEELSSISPNYPKPGVVFKDLTPAFADADAFAAMVDDLAAHFADRGITKVVGAEARGFIVGAAVALRLGAGFVPVASRASCRARCCASPMRWNTAPTWKEIHADALTSDDVVLIVDDLAATAAPRRPWCDSFAQAAPVWRASASSWSSPLDPRAAIAAETDAEAFSLVAVE